MSEDVRAVSSDKNDDHEVLACVTRLRAINEGLDICWFVVKNGSVSLADSFRFLRIVAVVDRRIS